MDFDQLQKAWQQQPIPDSIVIKEETLRQMTRRNQQDFLSTVLRRDIIEVTVCLLLVVFFLHNFTVTKSLSMLILGAGCFFVGSFFIIDRIIQKKRQPLYEDTLACCLNQSLRQINHQIWLLRNILWWYLLPIALGIFIGPILETGIEGLNAGHVVGALLYMGIYQMNQHAVLYGLIPRRNEILTLLHQLDPNNPDRVVTKPAPTYTTVSKIFDYTIGIMVGIFGLAGILLVVFSLFSNGAQHQELNINDFSNPSQYLTTALADPNQDNKLVILQARYGCGHEWVDVTQVVTQAVDGNSLSIFATNDLAGDPCPGKVKSLVVHYIYKGKQQTLQSQGHLQLGKEP
ncbi:DNAJC11 domain-containing protein [Planctomycetota bacterium]